MGNKSILCVVEGEVSEVKILKKLSAEFIQRDIDFVPIATNIYHFYHAYHKEVQEIGNEIDMFLFIKQYDKKGVLQGKIRYSPMSRPNNHKIKIELG